MRNFLLIITAFVIFTGCATTGQSGTSFPSPFQYTLVDSVQGSKDELFVRANEWLARTFRRNEVIQMNDKEAGKLIGKGVIETQTAINDFGIPTGGNDYIHYTIAIDVKDGRYRCVLSDFVHTGGTYKLNESASEIALFSFGPLDPTMAPTNQKRYRKVKTDVQDRATDLMQSLQSAMKTSNNF